MASNSTAYDIDKEAQSFLVKIENPPYNPISYFSDICKEVKDYTKPYYLAMQLATIGLDNKPNNRTICLRDITSNGITFVTNSKSNKCKEIKQNPNVTAIFLWSYKDDLGDIVREIKIEGIAAVASEEQIAKYYEEEPIFGKIRSIICVAGVVIDWNDLKLKHDKLLNDYKNGIDSLPQPES